MHDTPTPLALAPLSQFAIVTKTGFPHQLSSSPLSYSCPCPCPSACGLYCAQMNQRTDEATQVETLLAAALRPEGFTRDPLDYTCSYWLLVLLEGAGVATPHRYGSVQGGKGGGCFGGFDLLLCCVVAL